MPNMTNDFAVKDFTLFLTAGTAILMVAFLNVSFNSPIFLGVAGAGILATIILTITGKKKLTSTLHGSAGWATKQDLKKLLVPVNQPPAPGSLILGPAPKEIGGNYRLDLPLDLMLRHVALLGATGTGKGRGFFLWQLANFKGSFVYVDPKGEGWTHSSAYREQAFRYAPRDPNNSSCFNWIPLCSTDAAFCLNLATAIVSNSDSAKSGDFWVKTGSFFLASVFAHASTFDTPTPAAAYDFMSPSAPIDGQMPERVGEQILNLLLKSPNDIARAYAMNLCVAADPKLIGSIMIGVIANLIWLKDENVRRFTSASFIPPDFTTMVEKETGVYWVLSEKDVITLKPLSSLFFTVLFNQLKDYDEGLKKAGRSMKDVSLPICFFLDEVANIGKINALETETAILRGRNIGLVLGIQSIAQLELVYGKAAGQVIYENCNTKLVLAGVGIESAKPISARLGVQTIVEEVQSRSKRGGWFGEETITTQMRETARPLLVPDEVCCIGEREQIAIVANLPGVKTDRYWYTQAPATREANKLGPTLTMPPHILEGDDPETNRRKAENLVKGQTQGKKGSAPATPSSAEAARQAKGKAKNN